MSSKSPQEEGGPSPRPTETTAQSRGSLDAPAREAIQAFCQYLRELEIDPEASWEGFVAQNKAHASDLAMLLDQYERVTGILESLAPTASFSARLRQHYGEGVDPEISLSGDAPRSRPSGSSGSGGMRTRLSALNPDTGRYELKQEIARGGMGAIMEVWDSELRRTLAMKVVLGGKAAPGSSQSSEEVAERRLSRFLEEAQITGQLDHPGIVPVHDIGIDESARVYFTMQLIDGHDLRKVFEMARMEKGGWNPARVISVFVRVCEAMAYAHSKNVLHRDLKPANIMVGAFGEAYVMDWGLAKVHDRIGPEQPHEATEHDEEATPRERDHKIHTDRSDGSTTEGSPLQTLDGDIVGTPSYMAPEQARGKLGEIGYHSDIYSMGAMLYHLLSGHAPYEPLGEKVPAHTILEAVRKAPPWPLQRLNPDVDNELAAICEKAMSREPKLRYESMLALGEDLRAWVEGRGVGAYTSGVLYETRKWMARNKATTAAMGLIAFLMTVSVVLFIYLQQSNFTKLEKKEAETQKAVLATEEARREATANAEAALANEQQANSERDRAERETEIARQQKLLADQHLEQATISQALAKRREAEAEATAYRSSINAAAFSLRLNEVDAVRQNLRGCNAESRGWEWRHLNLAADPSLGDPIVEGEGVTDMAVARNGDVVLTYGFGRKPRLWDVKGRLPRKVDIKFPGFVIASSSSKLHQLRCALSPDAGIVAVTNPTDNSLRVINARSGEQIYAFAKALEPIMAVEFNSTGSRIGMGSEDGEGWIIDTPRARVIAELSGHTGSINALSFSDDGQRVATGSSDTTARIWDANTGEELLQLDGHHTQKISALAWSPDDSRIVTASFDGSLAVWNSESGAMITVMHGHRGSVLDASFSHDGLVVFSAGEDRTVRMWNSASGRQTRVFNGHESEVRSLVRLGDSGGVASVDFEGTLRFWDRRWDASQTTFELPQGMTFGKLGFGADNRSVFASSGTGSLRLLDGDLGADLGGAFVDPKAAMPATHTLFAHARGAGRVAAATSDSRIQVFACESRELLLELDGFKDPVAHMAISDDGSTLVLGGKRKSVTIVDLESGSRRALEELRFNLSALALSPDGAWLITGESDESLRVWDARTGDPISSHRDAHSNRITDLKVSDDGQLMASTSNDNFARIWSLPNLELYGRELEDHHVPVTSVAFSPTERRMATGASDGQIRLWSLDSPQSLFTILAFEGSVRDLEFSADGTRLVASGEGGGVKIWETSGAEDRYRVRFGEELESSR